MILCTLHLPISLPFSFPSSFPSSFSSPFPFSFPFQRLAKLRQPIHGLLNSGLNTPACVNGYSTFVIGKADIQALRWDEFIYRVDIWKSNEGEAM